MQILPRYLGILASVGGVKHEKGAWKVTWDIIEEKVQISQHHCCVYATFEPAKNGLQSNKFVKCVENMSRQT